MLLQQCFEMFFIWTLNASRVIFVTFNFSCAVYAVFVRKLSKRMSNFWMVCVSENRI